MDLDQTDNLMKCFPDGTKRYSDETDFKTLWNIVGEEEEDWNLGNNIVIIWDGYPESDDSLVNFKSHLTPIDWAVAYSRWWFKEDRPKDKFTISILDAYSHRFSLENMNFYNVVLQSMQGWVKFYSFNKKDFPQAYSPLDMLKHIEGDLEAPTSSPNEKQIDFLSNMWQMSLTGSGNDHHSINNVLGPMLLSKTLPEVQKNIKAAPEPLMPKAFRRSLEWHGMISDEDAVKDSRILESGDNTSLILIDDQANHWLDVVFGWAYGKTWKRPEDKGEDKDNDKDKLKIIMKGDGQFGSVEMYYTGSPNCLIKKLEDFEIKDLCNQRFHLSFKEKNEILLFDLYLFSGQPDKDNNEIGYFQRVLKLVEELDKNNAIQGKTLKDDIKQKEKEYFALLTLLPRLIAEIDPSIPIIIFSSTGRREITEKFSGYNNIITCFEKPRVLGYSNTDAQLIRSNFSEAIKQAKPFIEVRNKLQDLLARGQCQQRQ